MEWYYAKNDKQIGPFDDREFASRVAAGEIRGDTLVWNESLDKWTPYSAVRGDTPPAPEQAGGGLQIETGDGPAAGRLEKCSECGRTFPADQLVTLGGARVCADCKPIVLKKLEEGVGNTWDWRYGGFWIRAVAKITDWILAGLLNYGIAIPLSFAIESSSNPMAAAVLSLFKIVVSVGVSATYATYFVGRFGATPGKMACGLKIVCADGSRVSYARAFGRFCAEMLSGLLFYVGYIMAGFDDEKRALHDRICGTRVVYR